MSIYQKNFGKSEVMGNFNANYFISLIDKQTYNFEIRKEIIKISVYFFNGVNIMNFWKKNEINEIQKLEFIFFIIMNVEKITNNYSQNSFKIDDSRSRWKIKNFLISEDIQIFLARMVAYIKYNNKKIIDFFSEDDKFANLTLVQIVDNEIAPILKELDSQTIYNNVHKFNSSNIIEDKRSAIESIYTQEMFEDKFKEFKTKHVGMKTVLNIDNLKNKIENFVRHNKEKDTNNQKIINYKNGLTDTEYIQELKEILYGLLLLEYINKKQEYLN